MNKEDKLVARFINDFADGLKIQNNPSTDHALMVLADAIKRGAHRLPRVIDGKPS